MATRATRSVPELGGDAMARIESAATRLFILHGYNGVSYLDIARELGITHSSIHYYYRTKAVLAEAVLRRVADATLGAMKGIWADSGTSLFDKFVATRNWIYAQYLVSNPGGKGGKPWGLLWRLSMDADSLPAGMKRFLRANVDKLEDHIAGGVAAVVDRHQPEVLAWHVVLVDVARGPGGVADSAEDAVRSGSGARGHAEAAERILQGGCGVPGQAIRRVVDEHGLAQAAEHRRRGHRDGVDHGHHWVVEPGDARDAEHRLHLRR